MITILRSHATKRQMAAMSKLLDGRIKLAVDIRRGILAGGGALHADCRSALLEEGSQPEDIWGATWRPSTKLLMYDSQYLRQNPELQFHPPHLVVEPHP